MKVNKKEQGLLVGIVILGFILIGLILFQHLEASEPPQLPQTYCTAESREGEFCPAIYKPVCGWFNTTIQCLHYPCAITASNSCEACHNPSVAYWTEDPCPAP